MKALVILEHIFYRDKNGEYWCDRVVDYSYLCRYLQSFDSIIVCARVQDIEKCTNDKWKLASGNNVSFVHLPEFTGAKKTVLNIKVSRI